MRYRLTSGTRLVYENDCLYQSTALEGALAAAADAPNGKTLVLQVQAPAGWQSLGSLDELERTTWVRFDVDHARQASLPGAMEHLRNRVQSLSIDRRPAERDHVSVLFSHRVEARRALTQATVDFPGFGWSERSDEKTEKSAL